MTEIALLTAVVGLAAGILTLVGGLWKVFSLITSLQRRDDALAHEMEQLEVYCNGIKQQLDHRYKRLNEQIQGQGSLLRDCEGFLIKHTAYEPRLRDAGARAPHSEE